MEQSEDFKRINEIIRSLEQIKLSTIDAVQSQEQEKTNNMIEVHFDRCMNALAARKAALLSEVSTKFQQQQIRAIECNAQVQQVLDTCNKLMQTGASIFDVDKKTAEHVWKGASGLSQPKIEIGKISANLPGDLLGSIKIHGSVTVSLPSSSFNFNPSGSPNSDFGPSSGVIPISISPDALSPNPTTYPTPYPIQGPNAALSPTCPSPYAAMRSPNSPNASPDPVRRSRSPSPNIPARNDGPNSNPTPFNTVSNSHLNDLSGPLCSTSNPSFSSPIPPLGSIPGSPKTDPVSTSNSNLYAALNPNPATNPNSSSVSGPNPYPIPGPYSTDPSPFTGPTSTTSTTSSTISSPTALLSPAQNTASTFTTTSNSSIVSGPTPFSGPTHVASSAVSADVPPILTRPRRRSGLFNPNVFTNAYHYFPSPPTPSPTFPPSLMPSLAPLTPLTPSLCPLSSVPSFAPLTPPSVTPSPLNPSLSPCPTLINQGNLYSYNPFGSATLTNSVPSTPNTL